MCRIQNVVIFFLMNMWIKTFTDFNTVKYKLMGVENVSLFQGPPVLPSYRRLFHLLANSSLGMRQAPPSSLSLVPKQQGTQWGLEHWQVSELYNERHSLLFRVHCLESWGYFFVLEQRQEISFHHLRKDILWARRQNDWDRSHLGGRPRTMKDLR